MRTGQPKVSSASGRADRASPGGRVIRLSDLLATLPEASKLLEPLADDPLIFGITDDSRCVQPGWLFVAVKGLHSDGHDYMTSAVQAGAAAVVCERPPKAALGVPCLLVGDSRKALGGLLSRFYRLDEACSTGRLKLIGITGTNGKTTCAYLVQHLLNAAEVRCGRITTIDRDLGGAQPLPAQMTTPPTTQLFVDLAAAVQTGCRAVALEVSSHALDQQRVAELRFAAAVFTNLTGDHLDYHGTMDAYAAAKARLFANLPADAVAIVNSDDRYAARMLAECRSRVLRYSSKSKAADLHGTVTACGLDGLRMRIDSPKGALEIQSRLIGRHNAMNVLAAVATALALGVEPHRIRAALREFAAVPGRLESVSNEPALPFRVLVDYAHTDDALKNVLEALRPLCEANLWVVFGCGGDRDRTKRPRMGRVAATLADRVVVTSDNPRTEPPDRIIDEILQGIPAGQRRHVHVEPDRAKAIRLAVDGAEPGDILLIAGKGHETYQIVGAQRRPFDDRQVAAEAMRSRFERAQDAGSAAARQNGRT